MAKAPAPAAPQDPLLDFNALRAQARAAGKGVRPPTHVYRVQVGQPKALDDGSRAVRFCFSDETVDRMGDSISAKGWQLHSFERNPVALWAHDSNAPPIGRAANVGVIDGRLMGDIEFAPPETYAFADTIYRLVVGKFLNAVSVGFIALDYEFADEEGREWGLDFKQQELLEISVCPVPANPMALADARSKGIDTRPLIGWAEKTLEGGGRVILPRADVEALCRAAKEPRSPRRRAGGGMTETDPAGGGAVVATCGRSTESECGLVNPLECSVHMATAQEDKRLSTIVAKAVADALAKSGIATAAPRRRRSVRREADATEDGAMDPDHEAALRGATVHLEAMGDALEEAADHHEKAMDLMSGIIKDLDTDIEAETGPDSSQSDEKAATARVLRTLARIREKAAS